jgi:hypothetical protein
MSVIRFGGDVKPRGFMANEWPGRQVISFTSKRRALRTVTSIRPAGDLTQAIRVWRPKIPSDEREAQRRRSYMRYRNWWVACKD